MASKLPKITRTLKNAVICITREGSLNEDPNDGFCIHPFCVAYNADSAKTSSDGYYQTFNVAYFSDGSTVPHCISRYLPKSELILPLPKANK